MAQDARLELGRYFTSNPFNKRGDIAKRLDFDDLFRAKPETGEYPFNASRFTTEDLLKRSMTKKLIQNPILNFVSNTPFFDDNQQVTPDYELFDGIGRFARPEEYDFEHGRPLTKQRPEDQPDFNRAWVEAYQVSPTLNPAKRVKNPMPRVRNPDPNNYIMQQMEAQVEEQNSPPASISALLEMKQTQSKEEDSRIGAKEENIENQ